MKAKETGDWLDVVEVLSPLFHLLALGPAVIVFVQNFGRDVRSRTDNGYRTLDASQPHLAFMLVSRRNVPRRTTKI